MRRRTERRTRLHPKHRRLLRLHGLARKLIDLKHLPNPTQCHAPRLPEQHVRRVHHGGVPRLAAAKLQRSDACAQDVHSAECE